jgi:hypothetical protein
VTTINRATWVDDDGSGATGTIINNARLQGDIYDRIDQSLATLDAKDASQDTSITANGPHKILSAQHTDSLAATLVTGDLLRADATGKLARLPAGTNGQALNVVAGLPAWADLGAWTAYQLSAATLSAATGTFTIPGGQASFPFTYAIVGKIGFLTLSLGACTTSAATAWVQVSLPAAIVPLLANSNQLGSIYTTALAVTVVNITSTGLKFFPNVAQSGTIPATTGLYLNAAIFFALA